MGDIGLGIMVWLNLIAILLLFKTANIALKDYEEQLKQGKDPVFNSTKHGIKNADFWKDGYKRRTTMSKTKKNLSKAKIQSSIQLNMKTVTREQMMSKKKKKKKKNHQGEGISYLDLKKKNHRLYLSFSSELVSF